MGHRYLVWEILVSNLKVANIFTLYTLLLIFQLFVILIVLPGLLLSFGARYDAAKRFIGSASRDGRTPPANCTGQTRNYFPALVVAYAVGLAMANFAVYAMKMGQPALLYLVPCCLGTMSYLGWKRGELNELWNTPKVLSTCDEILYGPIQQHTEDTAEEIGTNLRPIT